MPEVFDHFFRMLGTSTEEQLDLVRLDPGYRVFFEGYDATLDVRSGRAANLELFESVEPGAGRALDRYLDSAREIYDLSVQRFLYSSFQSSTALLRADVLRKGPRLSALLTRSLAAHVAARFRDHRLRQVLGYPAVFLGTAPDRAPSLYHLMSWMDLADGVYYPRGGFGTLAVALARVAERAGVRLHLSTEATAVEVSRRPRGAQVSGVTVRDRDGRTRLLEADL